MSTKLDSKNRKGANEPIGFGSPVGSAGKDGKKKKKHHHHHEKKKKSVPAPSPASDSESSFSGASDASRSSAASESSSASLTRSDSESSIGSAGRHGGKRVMYRTSAREERPMVGGHQPVEALATVFSEAHPWKTTIMTVAVHGSLEELDAKKTENGSILRILGDGVRMERTTPSVRARLTSKAAIASHADMQKKPRAYMQPTDIVREVRVIGAHNGFPCALHFQIPNLVASAGQHTFTAADGSPTSEACFTLQSGEKLEDHVVFKNDVRPEDVKLLSDYKTFTPANLEEGVTDIGERDGIRYKSIPYTSEKPHPVVDLARRKIPQEEMTKEQRDKYANEIPPELLSQSRDWPDRRIMAAHLWDKYKERTAKGMHESNPHSDVAHPLVYVSRVVDAPVYVKGGMASKSAKYDKVSSQSNWLHSAQIFTDRSTPEAKASVTSTPRQAWVKLEIRSSEIETLGSAGSI